MEIPSKTFLTGEYGVLDGGQALVLTHPPFFKVELSKSGTDFHPESPAGRLLNEFLAEQDFSFVDPYRGGGGFGGSTAELIAANLSLKNKALKTSELMSFYFDLFKTSFKAPSGADLCSQFLNANKKKSSLTLYQKEPLQYEEVTWPFESLSILICKTNTKLKTHKHLESLKEVSFLNLKQEASHLVSALKDKSKQNFIEAVKAFSREQKRLGLLAEKTDDLITSLEGLSGVLAVRGCGAMGADVVCVFCKSSLLDSIARQIVESNLNLQLITQIGYQDFNV